MNLGSEFHDFPQGEQHGRSPAFPDPSSQAQTGGGVLVCPGALFMQTEFMVLWMDQLHFPGIDLSIVKSVSSQVQSSILSGEDHFTSKQQVGETCAPEVIV